MRFGHRIVHAAFLFCLLGLFSPGVEKLFAEDAATTETGAAAATDTGSAAVTLSQAEQDAIAKAVAEKLASSTNGVKVEFHGFAELDMIGDDTESFKESVGNFPVTRPGVTAGENGATQFSLRNSRISLLAQVPETDGWKTKGYIETDFLGYDPAPNYAAPSTAAAPTNSEFNFYTQPSVRIRHAYLEAQNDGWDILCGQTWTLFGWQSNYFMSTIGVTPYMGVLFERTPQVRVTKTLGAEGDAQLQVAVAAVRPEESASEMPNFDGGLRFVLGSWKGRFSLAQGKVNTIPFSIGLSGTLRTYSYGVTTVPTNVQLNQTAQGSAVALDALIPLVPYDEKDGPSLVATGEWSVGNGDGDEMPNWSGGLPALATAVNGINLDGGIGGINAVGNFTLVDIQSWNGQLQFHFPPSWGTYLTAGYGEVFSDNAGALTGGGATASKIYNDDQAMFANIVHDFDKNLRAALEYARFDTHYAFGSSGTGAGSDVIDHRVELTTWYRF